MSKSRHILNLKTCLLGKSSTFWSNIQRNHTEQTSQSNSAKTRHRKAYEEKKQRQNEDNQTSTSLGSHGLMLDKNHYQRLNVQHDSTQEEVKSAYYSLSKVYHPDVAGKDNPNALENFRLITESYDILNDPTQRQSYDQTLEFRPSPSWPGQKATTSDNDATEYNYNVLYRTRHADRVIRRRQEAYMRAEMEKNPKKFQAGSFNRDSEDRSSPKYLEAMNLRLVNLRATQAKTSYGSSDDGSDFYRQHFHQTIHRRMEDIRSNAFFNSRRLQQCDYEKSPFIPSLIVIAFFSCFTLLFFVQMDIPAYLDDQLVAFSKRNSKKN